MGQTDSWLDTADRVDSLCFHNSLVVVWINLVIESAPSQYVSVIFFKRNPCILFYKLKTLQEKKKKPQFFQRPLREFYLLFNIHKDID